MNFASIVILGVIAATVLAILIHLLRRDSRKCGCGCGCGCGSNSSSDCNCGSDCKCTPENNCGCGGKN